MRAWLLAPLLLSQVLPGCLVLRAGGGGTLERGAAGPGRFDAEGGLVAPAPWSRDRGRLAVLAVSRKERADQEGWSLLAVEASRCLEPRCRPALADPPATLSDTYGGGPGVRDLGLRLEVGRDYAGAAATATLRLLGPVGLTGQVAAGVHTGSGSRPSAGLHLLLEVDCSFMGGG
jgi:hypothetical protein